MQGNPAKKNEYERKPISFWCHDLSFYNGRCTGVLERANNLAEHNPRTRRTLLATGLQEGGNGGDKMSLKTDRASVQEFMAQKNSSRRWSLSRPQQIRKYGIS